MLAPTCDAIAELEITRPLFEIVMPAESVAVCAPSGTASHSIGASVRYGRMRKLMSHSQG